MAIDSAAKRRSAMASGFGGWHTSVLPGADSSIVDEDRAMLLGSYFGFEAGEAFEMSLSLSITHPLGLDVSISTPEDLDA